MSFLACGVFCQFISFWSFFFFCVCEDYWRVDSLFDDEETKTKENKKTRLFSFRSFLLIFRVWCWHWWMFTHTRTHTRTHAHTHTRTHARTQARAPTHTHTHTHTHTKTDTNTHETDTHIHTQSHTHTRACMRQVCTHLIPHWPASTYTHGRKNVKIAGKYCVTHIHRKEASLNIDLIETL